AHERAHLSGRHHLLLLPFVAWREAFPWLPGTNYAYDSAHDLVELQADDAACNAVDRLTLARALARTSAMGTPEPVRTVDREVTVTRVRRLVAPHWPLHFGVRVLIVAAAATLIVGPAMMLLSIG
ncbi:MAG: M56 family peptidase, partial [bacterium]|nr:M56 family peptidase [bacterium]